MKPLVLPSVLWQCWLWKEVGCRFGGGDDTTRALHDPQLQLSPLTTPITLSSDEIQNGAILVRFTRGLSLKNGRIVCLFIVIVAWNMIISN